MKTHINNTLGALAFIVFLLVAYELGNDAGEYVAPIRKDAQVHIEMQRSDLCNAEGWPNTNESRIAFERACRDEIANGLTAI